VSCSSACLTHGVFCLQLVEALNEDYSDYVGLSGQLSGLEGAVVRMRQPLLEIQVCCSSPLAQAAALRTSSHCQPAAQRERADKAGLALMEQQTSRPPAVAGGAVGVQGRPP